MPRASRSGWPQRAFRPKRLAHGFVGFDVRATEQIDAVGDCRKNAVEGLLDRLGLTWQIEDQCTSAGHADLARKNRGRHVLEAHLTHLLSESREDAMRDSERRLRCDVARRRPRSASGE